MNKVISRKRANIKANIRRVKQILYTHRTMYVLTRDKSEAISLNNANCNVDFKIVNDDNYKDTLYFEGEAYAKKYKSMLVDGENGIFGYYEGQCVYRAWIKTKGAEFDCRSKILDINLGEAYIHYVLTKPDMRKKGIHSQGINNICKQFSDYKIYTIVESDNYGSIKGFENNGFYKCKRIELWCVGGIVKKREEDIQQKQIM